MHTAKKRVAAYAAFALLASFLGPLGHTLIPTVSAVPSGADVYFFVGNESGVRQPVLSNGNGTFTFGTAFSYGDNNRGGAIEDFDEDGDLDFVGCSNSTSFCDLFEQTAPGTFTHISPLDPSGSGIGGFESGMAAADFDLDGHADVVLGGGQNVARIYAGDGSGNFSLSIVNLSPTATTAAYFAKDTGDLDGNGYPDVVIGAAGGGNVYTYLNTGGVFSGPFLLFDSTSTTAPPNTIAVADFDNDGFVDIVAGGDASGDVSLWKGDGSGTNFSLVGVIHNFGTHFSGDSYDFNGDGNQDLVGVARATGDVLYIGGNGDGTFQAPVTIGTIAPSAFGIAAPPAPAIHSTVSGVIFKDQNANGLDDDGLGGLLGANLSLTGTDFLGNSVSLATTSDTNGNYTIEDVPIDDGNGYTLTVTGTPPAPTGTLLSATTTLSRVISVPKENTHALESFGYLLCTDADGDGFAAEGGACGALDCNDSNAAIHPGAAESCDSIDNDCDGTVDEGFIGLGDTCSAGIGECATTGQFVCDGTGNGTVCNAVPGDPSAELCDGLDNDCDAVIDNVDTDNDGVLECNNEDLCLGTTLPEAVPTQELKPNHYAHTDADGIFETGSNHDDSQYSLLDTGGCSCEQILDSLPGKKHGHEKFGCSAGIMENWVNGVHKDNCSMQEYESEVDDQCIAD